MIYLEDLETQKELWRDFLYQIFGTMIPDFSTPITNHSFLETDFFIMPEIPIGELLMAMCINFPLDCDEVIEDGGIHFESRNNERLFYYGYCDQGVTPYLLDCSHEEAQKRFGRSSLINFKEMMVLRLMKKWQGEKIDDGYFTMCSGFPDSKFGNIPLIGTRDGKIVFDMVHPIAYNSMDTGIRRKEILGAGI